MKKLIAMFFIIISLFGYNGNNLVFAENSKEILTEKVDRKFFPLMYNWGLVALEDAWFVTKSITKGSFKIVTRIPLSVYDIFTNYKAEKIQKLTDENIELKESVINLTKAVDKLKENNEKIKFVGENFSYLQELFIKCLNDSNCSKSLRKLDNFNETFLK